MNWLALLLISWGRSTHYSYRLHDFSVTIPRFYKYVYLNSFSLFAQLDSGMVCLQNAFFFLTYNLNGLKYRINRHLLIFLTRFPVCFNIFVVLFLLTPCFVVAVQSCMESIPIKKKVCGKVYTHAWAAILGEQNVRYMIMCAIYLLSLFMYLFISFCYWNDHHTLLKTCFWNKIYFFQFPRLIFERVDFKIMQRTLNISLFKGLLLFMFFS